MVTECVYVCVLQIPGSGNKDWLQALLSDHGGNAGLYPWEWLVWSSYSASGGAKHYCWHVNIRPSFLTLKEHMVMKHLRLLTMPNLYSVVSPVTMLLHVTPFNTFFISLRVRRRPQWRDLGSRPIKRTKWKRVFYPKCCIIVLTTSFCCFQFPTSSRQELTSTGGRFNRLKTLSEQPSTFPWR